VRHEGWLLKESGGPMSSLQPRFFVVIGGKLEYYKEETTKVSLKNAEGQPLGCTLQHSNVVTKVDAGLAQQQKALQEGDVVIGMNGDPLVNQLLQPAVERARASGATGLSFTVLRPKGKANHPTPPPPCAPGRRRRRRALLASVSILCLLTPPPPSLA
jgi:S1-C subfamily serine protease